MIDYTKEFNSSNGMLGAQADALQVTSIFKIVYGWMCAGLALSGVVAWYTVTSGLYTRILSGPGMIVCVIAELGLVIALGAGINKLPLVAAYLMFAAYAVVNGLTLSVIFLAYDLALIQRVFFITAGMFGGLAVWGTVTKGNLASIGSVCGMALWGLVIAGVVNIFVRSSGLDWILSFAGILIFTGLTMYDAQKIKQLSQGCSDREGVQRAGILGALMLYLDFVNLFLHILRFLGRKK